MNFNLLNNNIKEYHKLNIPHMPGIYGIKICNEYVYIGSSTNLYKRIKIHIEKATKPHRRDKKYYFLNAFQQYVTFDIIEICEKDSNRFDLESIEYQYINIYKPIFNVTGNNNHHFKGTYDDIESFCLGLYTMNDLKTLCY